MIFPRLCPLILVEQLKHLTEPCSEILAPPGRPFGMNEVHVFTNPRTANPIEPPTVTHISICCGSSYEFWKIHACIFSSSDPSITIHTGSLFTPSQHVFLVLTYH